MTLIHQSASRHQATILFCDIRGFTSLFDNRDPAEAVEFANSVLGALGNVVEAHHGTVDKFTGDGFLAHFGILGTETEDHAQKACACALAMFEALQNINSGRHDHDETVVQIGVGINTGEVATGVISTKTKSEFTVLGGVVNMAARIEGLTKYFSVDCLVSESTRLAVEDAFEFQPMPPKPLRGVAEKRITYWLTPTNTSY